MTLNPLKGTKHLTFPKLTPAQPCLSVAEDRELDIALQRIMHVYETCGRMIKAMKKYITSVKHIDEQDRRLTTNLSNCSLVHTDEEFRKIIENYHSVTTQIGETVEITVVHLQKTFIEPLEKLMREFVYIKDALMKREELANQWRTSFAKKKKYEDKREKTATIHVKLEKERKIEEAAAKELKVYHCNLLTELPLFLEKRLEYLKPTVQALIAIQLNYYGTTTKLFTQLMPESAEAAASSSSYTSSATLSDEEYQKKMSGLFDKLKELTIVKDD